MDLSRLICHGLQSAFLVTNITAEVPSISEDETLVREEYTICWDGEERRATAAANVRY